MLRESGIMNSYSITTTKRKCETGIRVFKKRKERKEKEKEDKVVNPVKLFFQFILKKIAILISDAKEYYYLRKNERMNSLIVV